MHHRLRLLKSAKGAVNRKVYGTSGLCCLWDRLYHGCLLGTHLLGADRSVVVNILQSLPHTQSRTRLRNRVWWSTLLKRSDWSLVHLCRWSPSEFLQGLNVLGTHLSTVSLSLEWTQNLPYSTNRSRCRLFGKAICLGCLDSKGWRGRWHLHAKLFAKCFWRAWSSQEWPDYGSFALIWDVWWLLFMYWTSILSSLHHAAFHPRLGLHCRHKTSCNLFLWFSNKRAPLGWRLFRVIFAVRGIT